MPPWATMPVIWRGAAIATVLPSSSSQLAIARYAVRREAGGPMLSLPTNRWWPRLRRPLPAARVPCISSASEQSSKIWSLAARLPNVVRRFYNSSRCRRARLCRLELPVVHLEHRGCCQQSCIGRMPTTVPWPSGRLIKRASVLGIRRLRCLVLLNLNWKSRQSRVRRAEPSSSQLLPSYLRDGPGWMKPRQRRCGAVAGLLHKILTLTIAIHLKAVVVLAEEAPAPAGCPPTRSTWPPSLCRCGIRHCPTRYRVAPPSISRSITTVARRPSRRSFPTVISAHGGRSTGCRSRW